MRFSVGYSLIDRNQFNAAIETFYESISEVYFSWPGIASGRSAYHMPDVEIRERQEILLEDLRAYKELGIGAVLLLNANCYGEKSLSDSFLQELIALVDRLQQSSGDLKAVTTASPFIAWGLKEAYPELEIRASVNMKISTTIGMEYLIDSFDSFYMAKELNRDPDALRNLSDWARARGKKIEILVNSGCLNNCSNQIFHDNLVAHEPEFKREDMSRYQPIQCRNYLKDPGNWSRLISHSNWIRPEDLDPYEQLFDTVKLATRMHFNPFMVIGAYVNGTHSGNILDLTEPSFSQLLFPQILDNSLFPDNWMTGTPTRSTSEDLLHTVMREVMY